MNANHEGEEEEMRTDNSGLVAVVRCESYDESEVKRAVARAIELIGGLENTLLCEGSGLDRNSRIVLKPNLLAKAEPDKACTTHPAVFKAVGSLLLEAGFCSLSYGDSPGNPMTGAETVAGECGIKEAAESLGIPLGKFDGGREVIFPEGRVADRFVLCDEIAEADAVINICKMKTHQLERITGAVKNTFGCVYGINKGASHARFATPEVFAKMIADLNGLVKPRLHIMDGVVAMEGNGPRSGAPKHMGVIMASVDPVAMDAVFCHLIGLKPELVPTNVSGMEQGIGTWKELRIVGENGEMTVDEAADAFGDMTFSVQRGAEYRGELRPVRFLAPFLEKKPVVDAGKCIGCGICVNACPVDGKAIKLEPAAVGRRSHRRAGADTTVDAKAAEKATADGTSGRQRRIAVYDYSRCIKCYCCQEMCPEEAITVKKSLLARIADRRWKI